MIHPAEKRLDNQQTNSPTVHLKGTTLDALLAENARFMTSIRQPFSSAYMSRGYNMVRAALSEQPKDLKETGKTKSFSVIEAKLQLQRERNGARKQKAKVGFREPLVTKQYEYEQTFVPVQRPKARDVLHVIDEHSRAESQQVIRENDISEDKNIEDYLTIDDDSEDEVFSLAATSFDETDFDDSICNHHEVGAIPRKRTHEMIEEEEGEFMDSNEKTKAEDESLFSSPKVAKIAPYYDDNEPTNLPSANQRVTNIRRSHGIKSVSPQLLRFQASRQFDGKPIASQPQAENPINEFKYLSLGWLTNGLSYISNRMNRLMS